MPTSEAPATDVNEPNKPNKPPQASPADSTAEGLRSRRVLCWWRRLGEPSPPTVRGSRWVDYDTHELLEMISELEDERRWARLREGALWALLVHLAILLGLFLLPKYIFVPPVVDKTARLDKDEFTYMDTPKIRPKVAPKATLKPPQIDKQTLEADAEGSSAHAGTAAPARDQARGAGAGSATAAATDRNKRR